jgi:hypothetical protein
VYAKQRLETLLGWGVSEVLYMDVKKINQGLIGMEAG